VTTGFGLPHTTTQQRDDVERLVGELGSHPQELVFDEPWEVRAFALAIAAHTSGQYPWKDFQESLVASIKTWENSVDDLADPSWSYFEHWVNALQDVLENSGHLDAGTVRARVQGVLDTPANRNHHEPHYEPVAIDPALTTRTGARA
jgi:nitrile hydratase accessory protein